MKEIKDIETPPFAPPYSFTITCPNCESHLGQEIGLLQWVTFEHIRINLSCEYCGYTHAALILNLDGKMIIDFDYED